MSRGGSSAQTCYSLAGSVTVRDTARNPAVLDAIHALAEELVVQVVVGTAEDNTMVILFGGGTMIPPANADRLSTVVRGLAPDAVEAARLREEASGERGELWVGTKAQVKRGKRLARIRAARAALLRLSRTDAAW